MSSTPRIRYIPRPDTTPEKELNALAVVYRFILDCHTKDKTVGPAPEPDSSDDAVIVGNAEGVSHVGQRPDRPT